jgi:hypothetical protein
MAVMDGEDAVIAEGDPVGISAEVPKDTLDAIEGGFAIDDPLFMIELAPKSLEVFRYFEIAYTVGEYKLIRLEAFLKKVQELSFE